MIWGLFVWPWIQSKVLVEEARDGWGWDLDNYLQGARLLFTIMELDHCNTFLYLSLFSKV
jgi:hypothetical protein